MMDEATVRQCCNTLYYNKILEHHLHLFAMWTECNPSKKLNSRIIIHRHVPTQFI